MADVGGETVLLHERTVEPRRLRSVVERVLERGGSLEGLFAAVGGGGGLELRCIAALPDGPLLIRSPAATGIVPTLVDLVPALDWDEREAHDLYGMSFTGGEHRALVAHPADPAEWMTSIVGDDVHQIAVGPIHAGVIESGHFRFHSVGERVLHVDTRLFYKHRGLERAAEGLSATAALPVMQRACAGCAAANTLAFAQAVEQAHGLWPSEGMRRARTLLLELERLYNHLNDLGQICAGVGFAAGAMVFASFKERAQRSIQTLVGHRFLFGSVAIGSSHLSISAVDAAATRSDLEDLRPDVARAWRALLLDASLRDRTRGAGALLTDEALRLGTVGPAARASGLRHDVRERSPRLWYPEFQTAMPEEATGDVASRMEARATELVQTFAILDDLLSDAIVPARAEAGRPTSAHGLGRVESARGRTVCVVEMEAGTIRRVHLRTSSYANWPSVARATVGAILPDFPLINKSFELCYACADR